MRRADLAIGVGLLLFSLFYAQQSFLIRRGFASDRLGPAFFPRLLALALGILAVLLIVRALAGRSDPSRPPAIRIGVFAGVLALVVVYALLMPRAGFLIATPLLLGSVIRILGLRDWTTLIGTALGITAVLYLVFGRALHVLLPMGPLR
ncbi:MAG: tripartite tricarboxylate transporter TctB family protein [Armatimonadota bacterium]|nr:tripartite tricarboxylate transporter TctB family protein [Armatimonadota bacterium]MDR7452144.1 tripartite tricarboxylate transporter TctB family protein [Armatimonadota bacterium]MDR7467868.1 tripartite tricarboxylate transporter TctB family protein [Armatimonadota bacterium]MDR7494756.1 tripartite tricarboxylate transporter TctB family protein [Armatimonadota bacterium]MDR7499581.1 tripartite tricarboxylate transporter TctB family protein [Armatimonadota bacterium]